MTGQSTCRAKILYLYTEVMGYTLATIRELVAEGAEVHLVHWDRKKLTPFQAETFDGLRLYPRSALSNKAVADLAGELAPDLVVVSGWQDRGYLPAARRMRRQGVPVVAGFDDQWKGTMRQRVAACGSAALQRFFSHAWVTGPMQYDYARRLGFSSGRIVQDLYSADLRLFQAVAEDRRPESKRVRRFIFVGRLESVKGIDVLLRAWESLVGEFQDWELLLIGNGSFEAAVAKASRVRRRAFLSPAEVALEMAAASFFVLPSRHEPWGVVLHEAVAAGLPVICSEAVGAAATFVIDGYNGYLFRPDSVDDLVRAIRALLTSDASQHQRMSRRSLELSRRITPQSSAANLLSLLEPRVTAHSGSSGRSQ